MKFTFKFDGLYLRKERFCLRGQTQIVLACFLDVLDSVTYSGTRFEDIQARCVRPQGGLPGKANAYRASEIQRYIKNIPAEIKHKVDFICERVSSSEGTSGWQVFLSSIGEEDLASTIAANFEIDSNPISAERIRELLSGQAGVNKRRSADPNSLAALVNTQDLERFLYAVEGRSHEISIQQRGIADAYANMRFPRQFVINAISEVLGAPELDVKKKTKNLEEKLDSYRKQLTELANPFDPGLSLEEAKDALKLAATFEVKRDKVEAFLDTSHPRPIARGIIPASPVALQQSPRSVEGMATAILHAKLYRRAGYTKYADLTLQLVERSLDDLSSLNIAAGLALSAKIERAWLKYIICGTEDYLSFDQLLVNIETLAANQRLIDANLQLALYTLRALYHRRISEAIFDTDLDSSMFHAEASIEYFWQAREVSFLSYDYDAVVDCLASAGSALYSLGKRKLLDRLVGSPVANHKKFWAEHALRLVALAHFTQRKLALASDRTFVLVYLAHIVNDSDLEDSTLAQIRYLGLPISRERIKKTIEENCMVLEKGSIGSSTGSTSPVLGELNGQLVRLQIVNLEESIKHLETGDPDNQGHTDELNQTMARLAAIYDRAKDIDNKRIRENLGHLKSRLEKLEHANSNASFQLLND
jgi:hypothetical protein